jgi:hypothetical protein
MNDERIRFRVRTTDDAFACDVRAKWMQLEENVAVLEVELRRHDGAAIELVSAAEACGLGVEQLRLQLRIGAIYAQRSRELDPQRCPVVTLAQGEGRARTAVVFEGRLAS